MEFFGRSDDGAGAGDGAEFGEEGGVHVREKHTTVWEGWAVGNGIPVDDCDKYRALARAPLMRMLELSFSMLPFILAK